MNKQSVRRAWLSSTLIFAVLGATIGVAGYRYYSAQRSALTAMMGNSLAAIASGKVAAVAQWRHERLVDATIIARQARQYRDDWNGLGVARFSPSPAVRAWLESFASTRYHDVAVMRNNGDMAFPHPQRAVTFSTEVREALRIATSTGRPALSEIHETPGKGDLHVDLIVPVYNRAGTLAGALLLYIEAETSLAALLPAWPIAFQSVETAIVRNDAANTLYFSSALQGKARLITIPATASDPTLRVHKGALEGRDFRDQDVFAVTMPIPETKWRLLTKVDAAEFQRRIESRENAISAIVMLLLVAAGLTAAFNWRHRASLLYWDLYLAEVKGRALTGHYGYLSRYSNDLIVLADEKGVIIETNERCESALGIQRAELAGCKFRSLVSDSWLAPFDKGWKRALEQDGAIFESELKRARGTVLPVEISARAIWVDGRAFSQAIVRDITERKQAEEDWQAILKTSPAGFCVLDSDGRLLDANEPYFEMAGRSRAELIGFDVTDVDPSQGPPDLLEHAARLRENGADRWETWYRRPDGRLYDLDVSAQFLPGHRRVFVFVRDITANKQALRELEQSQRLVSRIVQDTPNLLYIFEVRRRRYSFVNQAFEEFFGCSRSDLDRTGSKVPARLINLDDLERMAASQKSLEHLPESSVSEIEFRARRADGVWRHMRSREVVFSRSEDGKVSEVLGIAQDVTERLRASEDLLRANELLTATFNASPLAMILNDLEGTILRWNAAAEEIFGWREDEVLGCLVPLVPAAKMDEFRFNIAQLAAGNSIRGAEVVRQRKDGSLVDVSLWTAPIRGVSGEVTAIAAVLMDITEQKRARAELEQSQASLLRAHRMASLGSWSADAITGLSEWSDETYRILGLRKGEVTAGWDAYISTVHPEDRARVGQVRIAALSTQPQRWDHRIVRPDGKVRHLRQSLETTASVAGRPVQIAGTIQDITEYKILEEQLWQSQKLETVGRLAGGIAHDFNNLLTVINGYCEVLLRKAGADPFVRKGLSEILGAGERAAELTKNLLAFSRKQVLQTKAVDLTATILDMQNMLRRLIGDEVQLETDLASELVSVMADPIQLQQILLNLAVNARDAMPNGGALRIETKNIRQPDELPEAVSEFSPYVLLKLADTGTGMTADVRSHLFEPFFTTKEPGKGTGLGLSTVYGIVKQSGGMIAVDSAVGIGTTFRIYFPAVQAERSEVGKPRAEPAPPPAATVVISEDQEDVRRLLVSIVRELGYEAIEAAGGESAASIVDRSNGAVDLVITDVMMPGMSGFDLARVLLRTHPDLPVIFVSGYAAPLEPEDGSHPQWANRFIAKPFTREALVRKICEVLSGRTAAVRS